MNAITTDTTALLSRLGSEVAEGKIIPYLGPGVLEMGNEPCPIPTSPRELVGRLSAKVAVPGRIRNNLWGAAQYIESNRHRQTLEKILNETFATDPAPGAVHRWLASLETVPLIIDTWYDGAMAQALEDAGRTTWGQVQGVTRNGEWRDIWFRFYHRDGAEGEADEAGDWTTVLYKPHGSVKPASNYLISDSDYVEVLTEIDIQSPIPALVKDLRTDRGFLFLGCRFYDQMLRTYARQIAKRSKGPYYAVLPADLTRMEEKFLEEMSITPIHVPLEDAVAVLSGTAV